MEEYVFQFPINNTPRPAVSDLTGLLKEHFWELLNLIIPTSEGREVRVDGFKLLNDMDFIHRFCSVEEKGSHEKEDPLEIYEPRVGYIHRLLESLLRFVDLEVDGKPVQVNGFRLKNLNHWVGSGGGTTDLLAHAASHCNLNCRFCYNKGVPSILKPRGKEPEEEYREIQTRITFSSPRAKLNLFPRFGSPCESLVHPHILDILKSLREKTDEPFRISTNGSRLTPRMIQSLEKVNPIFLDISLNSAIPERRSWLMEDPHPEIALNSLAFLKDAGIPYSVVIVPWPFPSREIMRKDLRETVAFASDHGSSFIQVSLPGYSRFFSREELFSHEKVWDELKTLVLELRTTTDCPLILRPGLFEEYTDPIRINIPELIGVIKNSPLAKAGIRKGDRLLEISGIPLKNRPQARALLNILHKSDLQEASITVQRGDAKLDLALDLFCYDYPYTPETAINLGGVFPSSGIPEDWIENLSGIIDSHNAKKVLLLTSSLVRPVLEEMLRRNGHFFGLALYLRVPQNRYLGGNIFMGDLLVVEDFIEAISQFMKEEEVRPDLVLIPSSPFHMSRWGRDIVGRVYLDIERYSGLPVALVPCHPIFD